MLLRQEHIFPSVEIMKLKKIHFSRHLTVLLSLLSLIFSIGLTPHIEEMAHALVHQEGIRHHHSHAEAIRTKAIYSNNQHSQTNDHSHKYSFESDHLFATVKNFSFSLPLHSLVIFEEKISNLLQPSSYHIAYFYGFHPQGPPGLEFFISYPNKASPTA